MNEIDEIKMIASAILAELVKKKGICGFEVLVAERKVYS